MSARRFVSPDPGDDLAGVAARVLPDVDVDDAAQQLLSWNLHLAARAGLGRSGGRLLPSDIVFTEPPPAQSAAGPSAS